MLVVDKLSINLGSFSIKNISFKIPNGKYGVLMGRSGSGKTTILESICGLRKIDSGSIFIDGNDVTKLRPADRHIGFVPQDGVLFSTMKIFDQITFGCILRGYTKNDAKIRALQLSKDLGIEHLLDRNPYGLSGGEIQRVALARALASKPKFVCMDEPLSSLDEDSRESVCKLIKHLHRKEKLTVLHITHSHVEAELMGDIKFKLSDGKVIPIT